MLPIFLIVLGIFSRLVIHLPNFTPIIAVALFSGSYVNKKYSFLVPLSLMILSDLIIGLHDTLIFTWGSVILVTGLGLWLRSRRNAKNVFLTCAASSILYFVITNFGAWLSLYPQTWNGFVQCYTAALPYFRNTLLSTLLYTLLLFGLYEFIAYRVKNSRFSHILIPSG